MPEKKSKSGSALPIAAALILLGLVVYGTIRLSRPLPPAPLPNPNGYDYFVKAGQTLLGDPGTYSAMTEEELLSLLAKNTEALNLTRQGLARHSRIALDFSTNYITARRPESMATKKLAQLLASDGRLAEFQHDTNRAARIYLQAIRFGNEAVRGGVMIDRLVGSACEDIGVTSLQKLVDHLDAQNCRALIESLQETRQNREPLKDVLIHEREWMRRNSTLRERLQSFVPIPALNPVKRMEQGFVATVQSREYKLDQLMIQLASRAYEIEFGHRPKRLIDLAPRYLKAVPTVPRTGTNDSGFIWQLIK